jgi:hypothetical protein
MGKFRYQPALPSAHERGGSALGSELVPGSGDVKESDGEPVEKVSILAADGLCFGIDGPAWYLA